MNLVDIAINLLDIGCRKITTLNKEKILQMLWAKFIALHKASSMSWHHISMNTNLQVGSQISRDID